MQEDSKRYILRLIGPGIISGLNIDQVGGNLAYIPRIIEHITEMNNGR